MFNKIKNWLTQTGGKYIIADHDGSPLYVIMLADEYEKLISQKSRKQNPQNLSRQELIEKINHDVDVWKSSQTQDQEQNLEFGEKPETAEHNFIVEEIVEPELSEEIMEKLAKF